MSETNNIKAIMVCVVEKYQQLILSYPVKNITLIKEKVTHRKILYFISNQTNKKHLFWNQKNVENQLW